jgi:prevent-host-death family protein
MKRTSISDARNRLSALIDRVRHGETIIIEDRGVPVARLEPVAPLEGDDEGRLARLERQGIVRRPATSAPLKLAKGPQRKLKGDRTLSDMLIEERREGR